MSEITKAYERARAEFYVRRKSLRGKDGIQISLHDWLRVLGKKHPKVKLVISSKSVAWATFWPEPSFVIQFNLFNGQPKREIDYKNFNEIVGNK